MIKQRAIYRRVGWRDQVLAIANRDGETVDLENEAGRVVVKSLPFFETPPENAPASFALPAETDQKPEEPKREAAKKFKPAKG